MEKALYKITNLINGKIYIGQSVHPQRRWIEHCNKANTKTDNYPIHLAIAKYGKENFSFEIIEWTENFDKREIELIKQYNSLCPNGYNLARGGNSLALCGELHPRNTVSNEVLIKVIKELQLNNLSDREIAKEYNLTDKVVADINHGYSHRQENIHYPIREKRGKQKLTKEQVQEIKSLLQFSNLSYSEIGSKFGVTKSNIYHINTGRTFKEEKIIYPIRKVSANAN